MSANRKIFDQYAAASPENLINHLPGYLWRKNETPLEISSIVVGTVWKSPKRTTVLYTISFQGADPHSQRYIGYIVKDKNLKTELKKSKKNVVVNPKAGRAVTFIPEANLVLAAYPNDRKMKLFQLADLSSWAPQHVKKITGRKYTGTAWDFQEGTIKELRYVPDKRFTSLVSCTLHHRKKKVDIKIELIAKQISKEKKARQAYRRLRSLSKAWDSQLHATNPDYQLTGPVRIPAALAMHDHKPVLFLEKLAGRDLKDAISDIDLSKMMQATGCLLANFHKADRRVRPAITRRNEIDEVRETMEVIRTTCPIFTDRLQNMFKILRKSRWQDNAPVVLLHGSFRLNHVFIDGESLSLLDLDSIRMGHPAYDIANFIASLYFWEIQGSIEGGMRKEIIAFFLQGYDENTRFDISPQAVLWFLLSLLINKQAFKYVNHAHAGQEEKVDKILILAERLISHLTTADTTLVLSNLARILP